MSDPDGTLYSIDSPASGLNYGGASGMTLREQDDQMQMLRKENFHLKLRIYFLQQTQINTVNGSFQNKALECNNTIDNEKIELKVNII